MPVQAKPRGRRRRPAATARNPLHGRAALVTGAGVRIGAAIATALAHAGCDVVLHHHRSAQQAKALATALSATGAHVAVVGADLSKPGAANVVGAAAKALGRPLDLLVNNAATFPARKLRELRWPDLSATLALNAWAPLDLTRALEAQLPRGVVGSVVNLLDARLVDDDRGHAGYFLAKRMLADVTRLSALEFAPRIAVNAVAPGPTLPPASATASEAAQWSKRLQARLPLRRLPTPDDVAQAVLYLAASRAHTGQVLSVDGGRHLGRPET